MGQQFKNFERSKTSKDWSSSHLELPVFKIKNTFLPLTDSNLFYNNYENHQPGAVSYLPQHVFWIV